MTDYEFLCGVLKPANYTELLLYSGNLELGDLLDNLLYLFNFNWHLSQISLHLLIKNYLPQTTQCYVILLHYILLF